MLYRYRCNAPIGTIRKVHLPSQADGLDLLKKCITLFSTNIDFVIANDGPIISHFLIVRHIRIIGTTVDEGSIGGNKAPIWMLDAKKDNLGQYCTFV